MGRILFLLAILASFDLFASTFNEAAGDYAISGCIGNTSNPNLNYCNYDELIISKSDRSPNLTLFNFLKHGKSQLKFSIKVASTSARTQSLSEPGKYSLASEEHGIKSQISIEPLDAYEHLELSSEGNGTTYLFSLMLSKK